MFLRQTRVSVKETHQATAWPSRLAGCRIAVTFKFLTNVVGVFSPSSCLLPLWR